LAASRVTNPTWQNALKRSCRLCSSGDLGRLRPLVPAGAVNDPHQRVHRVARLCNRGTAHACRSPGRRRRIATAALRSSRPSGGYSLIVTRARPRRCSPTDLGSAETTNRRESLCLNAYLMNHWSRNSIRVCLAGVANTVGCRAEMTTSSPWRPSATEWPQAWRITRLTTCRPRQTLHRQKSPKQSIWRNEGCRATPQSTRRTADSAVLRVRRLLRKRTPPRAGWRRLLSHSSAWLSVECVSTERAVVAFATVRLAADLAADHLLWRPSLDGEQRSG
jgi:hypothetical protein